MPQIDKKFLSQGRLNTGGRAPFASARQLRNTAGGAGGNLFGGINLRAPQFITAERQPRIDQVGPVVEADKIQDVASIMNEAALKKADHQASLEAREKLIQARNEMRDAMFGEDGYLTKTGAEAVKGRLAAQQKIERINQFYMEGAPAHVRAKMFPSLNAEREQYLNNIAQYANTQEKQWEQDIKASEINDFKIQMGEFGADFEQTDASIESFVHKLYPDFEDGTVNETNKLKRQNLREELLQTHVEQLIYSPPGVDAAVQRFGQIKGNLRADTQIMLKKDIMSAIRTYNAEQERQESKARRRRNDIQEQVYGSYIARAIDNDPNNNPTSQEIADDVSTGFLSPTAARVLHRQMQSDFANDIGEYDRLTNLINAADLADVTEVQFIREQIMTSEGLDFGNKEQLLNKLSSVTGGNRKDAMKSAMDIIEAATVTPGYADFLDPKAEQLKIQAERELLTRAASGEDPVAVAYEIKRDGRYDPNDPINIDLPPLEMENGSLQRITDMTQLQQWANNVLPTIQEGPWKDELLERAMTIRHYLMTQGQVPTAREQGEPKEEEEDESGFFESMKEWFNSNRGGNASEQSGTESGGRASVSN